MDVYSTVNELHMHWNNQLEFQLQLDMVYPLESKITVILLLQLYNTNRKEGKQIVNGEYKSAPMQLRVLL